MFGNETVGEMKMSHQDGLTTVVSRVCFDVLRSRKVRREDVLTERTPPHRLRMESNLFRNIKLLACTEMPSSATGERFLPDLLHATSFVHRFK